MPRKSSNPYIVAKAFVDNILCRQWDERMDKITMAHAKSLLKDYELDDIMGCLELLKDGVIVSPYPLQTLAALRKFDPPLINQWFAYKDNPPPVYSLEYKDWQRRTHKEQPVAEPAEPQEEQLTLPMV